MFYVFVFTIFFSFLRPLPSRVSFAVQQTMVKVPCIFLYNLHESMLSWGERFFEVVLRKNNYLQF
jgi:hypothetical protein